MWSTKLKSLFIGEMMFEMMPNIIFNHCSCISTFNALEAKMEMENSQNISFKRGHW